MTSAAPMLLPRYPVYVPSKGRVDTSYTADFLVKDGVPFRLVVEPQEFDVYAAKFGPDRILTLPESNQGLIYARNWIKDHSIGEGHERHWQLDDNMRMVWRLYRGRRLPCNSGPALRCVEDFCDRYTNVAIAGLNYEMFGYGTSAPFYLNCHVYSCTLVNNAIPHRWRLRYNDDTDICLQVLADGWCTALINAFLVKKVRTMVLSGGNTTDLYQGDGRLKMARSLERMWPGVVETKRRFQRPQHVVKFAWQRFDTPLKLREGVDLAALAAAGPNNYGLELTKVKDPKSQSFRRWLAETADPDPGASTPLTPPPTPEEA